MFDVVLPLKALPQAKSRLAKVLTDVQRRDLVLAMAQDVVAVLLAWRDCRTLTIIQGTGWPLKLPVAANLQVIREDSCGGCDLNEILAAAINQLNGERYAVVFGDLPGLRITDLEALSGAFSRGQTVICCDSQNLGTNALAFQADDVPAFRFGGNSCSDYARYIPRERRVAVASPGLSFDVDTSAALYALLWGNKAAMPVGPETQKWLRKARSSGVLWQENAKFEVQQRGISR